MCIFIPRQIRTWVSLAAILPVAFSASTAGERINQEGRILGPTPVVAMPTLFNTKEADAIVAAMQIMPTDSPWNEDVSRRPRLANSDAMISQIKEDLGSSRQTLRAFSEMNYVLVPDDQPKIPIDFFNYPEESDPSPYPIPSDLPIESWPVGTGTLSLTQWELNVNADGGDRHAIVVEPSTGFIWETWLTQLVGTAWQASNGAKFDLKRNTLRPAGWTSGDAAGLPMFPALVRYDECERGMVEHAVRLLVKRTRLGPIYPATHQASVGSTSDPNIPAMGQRLRLKAGFEVPATWSREEKAVLNGLSKYGALVADNGNFFSISICPDERFAPGVFDHLATVGIDNFEVVQSTGPGEGPRSPGAPSVLAGNDLKTIAGTAVLLNGAADSPTNTALTVHWKKYSGPGEVTFSNSSGAYTAANFTAPGIYNLMLSATDGVHSVAYDAVQVTVADPEGAPATLPVVTVVPSALQLTIGSNRRAGFNLRLSCEQSTPVLIHFKVGGSAVEGVDFSSIGVMKKIKADHTFKAIRLVLNAQERVEHVVKLTLVPGDGYTVGSPRQAKIRLIAPAD